MFRRILIANRGEIALRIARTCREMGIAAAVIHSDADAGSLPVALADEAIGLGDPWCYLDSERIVRAAQEWGAEAIHPGYGFLAENGAFARLCREAGIAFIGPAPEVMELLGEKDRARAHARALDIPCLPGTDGPVSTVDEAARAAAAIGYPVLIKAVAGGGGRGMRVARDEDELREQLPRAMSEARSAFNVPDVYLEKYLEGARHVEVQVLADAHGHVVHLGERDCTIQRRHQKLIEESPSPAVGERVRQAMGEAAVRLLASVGYVNAGTVEFLVDPSGKFYFLEVNTRIQVEHPVTEMRFGVDLVAQQIRVAAGLPLPFSQKNLSARGWAIECRVNAEDPLRGFQPAPGLITGYAPPAGPGIRVDSAARDGWRLPPFYDSMMAKVIAWAPDRTGALNRMVRALEEFQVEGVPTTIPFHLAVLRHPAFAAGRVTTAFAETGVSGADIARWAGRLAKPARRSPPAQARRQPAIRELGGGGTSAAIPVAAIAAAVAAVLHDRPHRIACIVPSPASRKPSGMWGAAGRSNLMNQRRALCNFGWYRGNGRVQQLAPPLRGDR
ncbi:MAG: acetyl-CoA carboxylase biotin carboxylase subunit [Firmicutes bacterium]|nr:acetyl-CoA carboxylase biotin carboxylase subunit [Bacillota bacterium]